MVFPEKFSDKEHFDILDVLRTIAAFQVVVSHGASVYFQNPGPFLTGVFTLINKLNFGVPLFFILSGFLMACQLNNNISPGTFYRNRAAKIYPTYFILVTALFFLRDFSNFDYFLHIIGIHNWNSAYMYSMSSQLWSLAVEMQFYIAVPLFYRRWYQKLSIQTMCVWLLCVIFSTWLFIYLSASHDSIQGLKSLMLVYGHTITNISGLLWGMLLYKFYHGRYQPKYLVEWLITSIFLVLGLGQWLSPGMTSLDNDFSQPLVALAACTLIMAWQFSSFLLVYLLLEKRIVVPLIFQFTAGISYQWYLLHILILDWLVTYKTNNQYMGFAVYIALTFIAACLSTYVLEKPLWRWVRSWGSKK